MKSLTLLFVFVFATNLFAQVPTYVPKNGLLGWWGFNGNANDESGNKLNGSVYGATPATDRFTNNSSCYFFDGVDDYITLGDWLTDSAFTISMWVNPDLQNGWATIIDNNHISISNWVFHTIESWQTNGYSFMTSSLIELDSNEWSHVILSYSMGEVRVFVNGVLMSESLAFLNYDLPTSLYLGKRGRDNDGAFGSRFWKGKLDELGIWNRALSQSEITELYQTKATGIQDEKYYTFLIYPNPASTFITVDCGDNSELSSYSFTITNSLGQEKLVYNFTTRFQQIDISKIGGAGLYIISIRDGNNTVIETRKLLIQ